jgi:hypothetical protein
MTQVYSATGPAPSGAGSRASETLKKIAAPLVRKPRLATALAVVAILGIALGARAYRTPDAQPPPVQVAAPQAAPEPAPAPAAPPADLPPIRGLPPEPEHTIAVVPPPAEAPEKKPAKEAKERRKSAAHVAAREPPRPITPPPDEPVAAPPAVPAVVSFAIAPWGEVHVDGKMLGVSPPLQNVELAPGRHRVELRNTASQPYVVTINAKPGERIRIKHKFN